MEEMQRKVMVGDSEELGFFAWKEVEMEYRNLCITNFTAGK